MPNCLKLLMHAAARPVSFALPNTGNNKAARTAMMAMTAKSSMSVNARLALDLGSGPGSVTVRRIFIGVVGILRLPVSWSKPKRFLADAECSAADKVHEQAGADVSRRIIREEESAPTHVGGYFVTGPAKGHARTAPGSQAQRCW